MGLTGPFTRLPQPPRTRDGNTDPRELAKWYDRIWLTLSSTKGIAWDIVDKAGSSLADLEIRLHSMLQNILGTGENHVSQIENDAITDISAMSGGILTKTDATTYTHRTITGTTDEVDVSYGDGIGGDPVIGLPDRIATPRYFGTATDYSKFESDGTYMASGAATVWNDIDFAIVPRVIGAGTPNYVALQGNLNMLQWAVNDAEQITSQEMIHPWKQGSPVTWHIHIVTGGTDVTDRYHQWSIEYTWANYGGTLPANVTVNSGDLLIPANTPSKTHLIYDISTWTPTGGHIAAHVKARLKRIASAGAAPTANVFCEMLQLHVECDTIGSRQITSK